MDDTSSANAQGHPPRPSGQLGPAAGPATGPSAGPAQLPPQMFTTAAQLLDLTDKKLMLVLRDGRKLIGVLRSWDQFANLVLTSTTERYFVDHSDGRKLFADLHRGIFLVRGENVLLIGEIDLDKDDDPPPGYTEAPIDEVFGIKKEEEKQRKKSEKIRARRVGELWGGELEASGEVLF